MGDRLAALRAAFWRHWLTPEQRRERRNRYARTYRAKRKRLGLCVQCSKPAVEVAECDDHRLRRKVLAAQKPVC